MPNVAGLTARLSRLLQRAKEEAMIPLADVEGMVGELRTLRAAEAVAVAEGAGIVRPGRTKKEVLARVRGKLDAGRRVMDQTWC